MSVRGAWVVGALWLPLLVVSSLPVSALPVSALPSSASDGTVEVDKVSLTADFRLRLESDWNSQDASGREREDRGRARVRARVGVTFEPSPNLELGLRLRSGSDASHQSPHITVLDFDGNDTGDAHFNLDKWYVKGSRGRLSGWGGRNGFPFWRQNELFWDDDVTPVGLAGSFRDDVGLSGELTLNLAYLTLPVGMRELSGNLAGGQAVYARKADRSLTLAAGYFRFEADPDNPDAAMLLRGNGLRDYQILVGSAQLGLVAAGRPLVLGADYFHNAESYSPTDPDPRSAANRDQKDGFVLSALWGRTGSKGDWLVGYYYAEIEALAVHASYAQDDWMRWGSAVETRGSDFRGHELRFARDLTEGAGVVVRLYAVQGITSTEDGNRVRVDFNLRF